MFLKRETHNRLVVKEKISKFVKGNTLLQQHTEYNTNKASLELQKLSLHLLIFVLTKENKYLTHADYKDCLNPMKFADQHIQQVPRWSKNKSLLCHGCF